jgi:membrane carboxypeptidase/penicillin-binding protein PbpC
VTILRRENPSLPPRAEREGDRGRKLRRKAVWLWPPLVFALLSALTYLVLPGPALERSRDLSGLVLARDGSILRGFLSADGKWRLPATTDSVDPLYRKMLLATEDQRFATHPGVDALAVLRAFAQLASHGHVISGASTLSMQVVRLLERRPRSLAPKAVEAAEALSLERHLGKDAILSLYLTLAPFGGNLEGVRAASLAYLGKEPRPLSPGEAALLVSLPRAPERLRPDRHPDAARQARDAVLARVREKGVIAEQVLLEARAEPVPQHRLALPFHAVHLARALRNDTPDAAEQWTTIDPLLQRQVEALLRREAASLDPQATLAALVVDNRERRVIAYGGNAVFDSAERHGTLDMARAVRSPGSALKPFIYAMAFDRLIIHPETVLEDRPRHFGDYAPTDFDGRFLGAVSAGAARAKPFYGGARRGRRAAAPSDSDRRSRARDRARRRRDLIDRSGDALRGAGACRRRCAVALPDGRFAGSRDRDLWRARRLLRRRDLARCAAAPGRAARRIAAAAARGQDRHLLRVPRLLGHWLRRAGDDRGVGGAAGRDADAGA